MPTTAPATISLPFPTTSEPSLTIRAGACRLYVAVAEQAEWVTGGYSNPDLSPPVVREGAEAVIEPAYDLVDWIGRYGVPELRLTLGTGRPFRLRVSIGAGTGDLRLGGAPLLGLDVSAGAGPATLTFDRPNPAPMARLRLGVGAGRLEARGLGNAGFEQLRVDGGAAECILDFSGTAPRSSTARLSAALGRIEVRIPQDRAAEVSVSSVLGRASVDSGYVERRPFYLTQAAAAGAPPVFRIQVSTALGHLDLVTLRS